MNTRGIREVPMPSVRVIVDKNGVTHRVAEFTEQHRQFLVDLRESVIKLRATQGPINPPTNLSATAQAFSNFIQFTRSGNADYYEVLHGTTANIKDPTTVTVDLGNSSQFLDHVGNSGIKKFYWVRARKNTGESSNETGPVIATTLVAATGVTPPTPPPPSNIIVIDRITGRQVPYTLGTRGRLLD